MDNPWSPSPPPAPAARRGTPWWAWLLMGLAGASLLSCVSCLGLFMWFGANTPETFAYAGNQVPAAYLQTARDAGVLDTDEKITWFFSDALLDIREGFYFVSDRRVVIYKEDAQPPATVVGFDQISEVELLRNTSFFIDSTITLTLEDGDVVAFPVSSEKDRDVKFYQAIAARAPEAKSTQR